MIDLRWDLLLCFLMISEFLGSVCKENYDLIVIKVFIFCIFENSMKSILVFCMLEDVDCKVILFVRDFWVVIVLVFSVGFFKELKGDFKVGIWSFSYLNCKEIEYNLDFVRKLLELL